MRNCKFVIFVFGLLVDVTMAANSDYDPHWTTNDFWEVQVNYFVSSYDYNPSNAWPTTILTNVQEIYKYKVVKVDQQYETVTLRVDRTRFDVDFAARELTFGQNSLVLRRVVQFADNEVKSDDKNPYGGNEAWLFVNNDLADCIVLDFPKIPESSTNEIRVVYRKNNFSDSSIKTKDSEGSFLHSVSFNANNVAITMNSPSNGIPDRMVSFVWEKGKKWWKSATVTCGTNIAISATLRE